VIPERLTSRSKGPSVGHSCPNTRHEKIMALWKERRRRREEEEIGGWMRVTLCIVNTTGIHMGHYFTCKEDPLHTYVFSIVRNDHPPKSIGRCCSGSDLLLSFP